MAKLNINGKVRDVKVEDDTPLLWVIREHVGLTGTKYGCGVAQCGACSVHINGEVQRSCSVPVRQREGQRQDRHHRRAVAERLAPGAEGLGYGRRAAMRLLPVRPDHGRGRAARRRSRGRPTKDIDAAMTNICRCGTYPAHPRRPCIMAAGGSTSASHGSRRARWKTS